MLSREEQKLETREKILAAAVNIISEKGIDLTSIKDITNRAGVAVGTFYLYFDSKDDVIRNLDRTQHKDLINKIKTMKNLSCIQKIYEYFHEWYKISEELEPGFIREWHCLLLKSSKYRDEKKIDLHGGELEHEHVLELLKDAVEAGELDENTPFNDIARMLVCGLWGSSIYLCNAPNGVSRKKIADDFVKYVVKSLLNPYLLR